MDSLKISGDVYQGPQVGTASIFVPDQGLEISNLPLYRLVGGGLNVPYELLDFQEDQR